MILPFFPSPRDLSIFVFFTSNHIELTWRFGAVRSQKLWTEKALSVRARKSENKFEI